MPKSNNLKSRSRNETNLPHTKEKHHIIILYFIRGQVSTHPPDQSGLNARPVWTKRAPMASFLSLEYAERESKRVFYEGGRTFLALGGKPPHHSRAPLRPHFVASYPPPRGFAPKTQRHPPACPGAPPARRTAASRYAACPPNRGLSYLPFRAKQAAVKRQAKRLDAVLCYPPHPRKALDGLIPRVSCATGASRTAASRYRGLSPKRSLEASVKQTAQT
jgi:hypothetical protein